MVAPYRSGYCHREVEMKYPLPLYDKIAGCIGHVEVTLAYAQPWNDYSCSVLLLIFQLLSDRIMVRVGGGWDTLEHFLLEHDPCRIQRFISGRMILVSPASLLDSQHGCIASPHAKESGQTP